MQFKLLLTFTLSVLFSTLIYSQVTIKGKVTNSGGDPIEGVQLRLQLSPYETITSEDGTFTFSDLSLPKGFLFTLNYTHIAYQPSPDTFTITDLDQQININKTLTSKYYELLEVPVISPTRIYSPFHTVQIDGEELNKHNLGQDITFLLRRTPSTVVTSDAGTGIGYTGMRIRGSDATRTNVTINGIPLNDAESQGTFFVNLPNLAASVNDVQIQRGIGNSTNGSGAFGAGVHLNTLPEYADQYVEIEGGYGTFNTWKGSLAAGSGIFAKRFSIEARASIIESDGYIDRASSELRSATATLSYWGPNSAVHLVVLAGRERTYQAWFGVPSTFVEKDSARTYNPAGLKPDGTFHDNQVDDYQQDHLQLHWQRNLASNTEFHLAGHYTRGKGFFEEYINQDIQFGNDARFDTYGLPNQVFNGVVVEDTNLVRRRWLDNHFFGAVATVNFDAEIAAFSVGGAANHYIGNHFGELIESDIPIEQGLPQRYYDADADKTDANVFLKTSIPIQSGIFAFADLQFRHVVYDWETIDNSISSKNTYGFFNPKVGLTVKPDQESRVYASYALAHREPSRFDFLASPIDQPSRERMHNIELGYESNFKRTYLSLNGFFMLYDDQLVPTGAINIDALPIRTNVESSYRLGLELSAEREIADRWTVSGTAAWSNNRIKEFTESIADFDDGSEILITHDNTPIAFSPDLIANVELEYQLIDKKNQSLSITAMPKYVSKQYIDNTGNEATTLDAYSFTDLRLRYAFRPRGIDELVFTFLLRNVFDQQFVTNAWTSRYSSSFDPRPSDPYARLESGNIYNSTGFFPQAGRNFLMGLKVRF